MWREDDWENKYSEEHYKKHLPFAKRGIDPLEIEWSMEDCERAFEVGADAMLKALIRKGYVSQVSIATITGSEVINEAK